MAFSSSPAVPAAFSPLPSVYVPFTSTWLPMRAAHRWRQPQQIMFTESTTRLQMSISSLCLCASVWRKERRTCVLWPAWQNKWKLETNLERIQAASPFSPNNLLHQLCIDKKRRFLPLTRIAIMGTGNILPCTKAWLITPRSLYFALRILYFFSFFATGTAESRRK